MQGDSGEMKVAETTSPADGVGQKSDPGPRERLIGLGSILLIVVFTFVASVVSRMVGESSPAGSAAALGGIVLSLVVVWLTQRMLGGGWSEIGFRRPKSWPRAVALGLGLALVSGVVVQAALTYVILPLSGVGPDVSRFDSVRGDWMTLVGTILTVWVTSALPEEIIWRGFWMTRTSELMGGGRWAWATALILSSVHFALIHFYQGISGIAVTGLAGLLFGIAYLVVGRNLWVVIFAHAWVHLMSFTLLYLELL